MVNYLRNVVYQKCYDPDCRNYESNPIKLPPHLQRRKDETTPIINLLDSDSDFEKDLEEFISGDEMPDFFQNDEAFEKELASYQSHDEI